MKHAASCLLAYLRDAEADPAKVAHFASVLLRIFHDHQKVDRVTVPMLRMLDRLLASGSLACLAGCPPLDPIPDLVPAAVPPVGGDTGSGGGGGAEAAGGENVPLDG